MPLGFLLLSNQALHKCVGDQQSFRSLQTPIKALFVHPSPLIEKYRLWNEYFYSGLKIPEAQENWDQDVNVNKLILLGYVK